MKKDRGVLLTVWLVLMIIFNALAALFYFVEGSFTADLLQLPIWVPYLLGILAALNVVFAVLLFQWNKLGFYGICVNAAIVFVINTIIIGLLQALFGLIGVVILYFILRPKWKMFS